ncbi:hypothetical protein H1O16_gp326 [Burkholderia phage BcepSaruman]|uniref:Uncharacterized protein n=1 Tax=Burkholderia phage BcepSaruman TaxID=2530032 RepID=A0A4D5ZDG1_9CAUD|nr:hypothetical protein H1O16_gp326 [Burkholderia phage BcepSaruman]QBX06739.1 hypothetical protein BcepSaruman_326 [Burkholderia phage BcepSaruman]
MEEPKAKFVEYPELVGTERFEAFVDQTLEKHLVEWFGETALKEAEGMINQTRIASMARSLLNKFLSYARVEQGPLLKPDTAIDAARAFANVELRADRKELTDWETVFASQLARLLVRGPQ